MKTMKHSLTWLMAAVMSLALITNASAENAARTGKVVRIKGDARFSTGKKIWETLKVGAVLKSGYVVQTGKDSFVDIVINEDASAAAFKMQVPKSSDAPSSTKSGAGAGASAIPTPDQDVVRVLEDSYLVVDSLTAKNTGGGNVTETLLDLKKGSIFGSVKKQAAASRFEVKIPNGVAGIRGTVFMISASGKIACLTGSVVAAFSGTSGNVDTQVVGGGSQLDTKTGESASIPAAASGSMASIGGELGGYSKDKSSNDKNDKSQGAEHANDHGLIHVTKNHP